jgi:hypothetical protein
MMGNVRVHEFVTHCNMFIAWSFGNLQGWLQGDVARLASKQRLLTKWTAVDPVGGPPSASTTAALQVRTTPLPDVFVFEGNQIRH